MVAGGPPRYRIQNTEYRIQNTECRAFPDMPVNAGAGTARGKGWTADAVGLQAAQTYESYDHESGEPQGMYVQLFRTNYCAGVRRLKSVFELVGCVARASSKVGRMCERHANFFPPHSLSI